MIGFFKVAMMSLSASAQSGNGSLTRIARLHMVDSQVRPNGITNSALVDVLLGLPREGFLPADQRALAYMEGRLPIGPGRYLTEPMIFAKLVQFAEIEPEHKVLLVGAGTGYGAAVLSRLVAQIVAVEVDQILADQAKANLSGLGISNVTLVAGPLALGAAAFGPYDRIIIDGSVDQIPQGLLDQLVDLGHLIGVVVDQGLSRGMIYTRSGGAFGHRPVFDGRTARLPGFEKPEGFVF